MMSRETIPSDVAKALLSVQEELRNPKFDSVNPHFRSQYASLAEVLATVKPVLSKYHLVLLQQLDCDGHVVAINTKLLHVDTGYELDCGRIALTVPQKAENQVQALGAVITYLRRYSILTALGVVGDEDDDGESVNAVPPSVKVDEEKRQLALRSFREMGLPSSALQELERLSLEDLRELYVQTKEMMGKVRKAGLEATLVEIIPTTGLKDMLGSYRKNSYAFMKMLENVRDKGIKGASGVVDKVS